MTPCSRRRSTSTPACGLAALAADQHGLGLRRIGSPKTSSPALRSVWPGLDDVGDDVGDPERDGGLDGAVEAHDRGARCRARRGASRPGPGSWSRPGGPTRRRARSTVPGRAANRKVESPKPSAIISTASDAGVEQQVAAGDADVEGAGADVDGDVARAQVEELDVVVGVGDARAPWGRGGCGSRPPQHLAAAGSDSDPLLGTAMRSMGGGALAVRGGRRRRRARCPWRA